MWQRVLRLRLLTLRNTQLSSIKLYAASSSLVSTSGTAVVMLVIMLELDLSTVYSRLANIGSMPMWRRVTCDHGVHEKQAAIHGLPEAWPLSL